MYKCVICGKDDDIKNMAEFPMGEGSTMFVHAECQRIYKLGENPYWIAKTLLEIKEKLNDE